MLFHQIKILNLNNKSNINKFIKDKLKNTILNKKINDKIIEKLKENNNGENILKIKCPNMNNENNYFEKKSKLVNCISNKFINEKINIEIDSGNNLSSNNNNNSNLIHKNVNFTKKDDLNITGNKKCNKIKDQSKDNDNEEKIVSIKSQLR